MNSFAFVSKAVIAGLALALLVVWLIYLDKSPEPISAPINQAPEPSTELLPAGTMQGPVSYADAVNKAAPSVVNIYTTKTVQVRQRPSILQRFFGQNGSVGNRVQTGLGSGVIFSEQGHIVTNYHVIHDAEDIHVLLRDGRQAPARSVGSDPETDLAILHIELDELSPISAGSSEAIHVGDVVLAIGNPFGVGQTVTMGIVSATGRDRLGVNTFENFIQTDAAINPGNSGGALVNAFGELVGINTAIFSQGGGSDGIGFAIPVDMVRNVLTEIIQNGRVVRGWLGVEARNLPAQGRLANMQGVLVTGIFRNGPADRAGLRPGDVIAEINAQPVTDLKVLLKLISINKPGTELELKILRNNEFNLTTAELMQRPAANQQVRGPR